MILDEINGDGECRVSTVMAKMLEVQEIMSYLPVTQQVDTRALKRLLRLALQNIISLWEQQAILL